jgi:hypothetical protein
MPAVSTGRNSSANASRQDNALMTTLMHQCLIMQQQLQPKLMHQTAACDALPVKRKYRLAMHHDNASLNAPQVTTDAS